MKLAIATISEEGKTIGIHPSEEWVKKVVKESFLAEKPDVNSFSGELTLLRTDENITLVGKVQGILHPLCDRCAEAYNQPIEVPISMHLTPEFDKSPRPEKFTDLEEDESTLSEGDLHFAFYHGPEIDLGDILREQFLFALPPRFLCDENCRGLCPRCGTNLNRKTCACSPFEELDPRWEALKKLKFR